MLIARVATPNGPRMGQVKDDRITLYTTAEGQPVSELTAIINGQAQLSAETLPLAETKLLAPTGRPGKIVAIGLNYMDHAREQNAPIPERPLIFAKFPTTVIGPGDTIEWSASLTEQVDYEVELAVVIGQNARRVSEAEALDYVFGYTVANDVSARDLQFGDKQWVRGKSLDTFCPLGPWIVTADVVPDPQNLPLYCDLNGQIMQDGHTRDMIFSVRQLVSFCSHAFTLEPGDVIVTGTPAGVGVFRKPPVFLNDGDRVTVGIEGIGELSNPCRVI